MDVDTRWNGKPYPWKQAVRDLVLRMHQDPRWRSAKDAAWWWKAMEFPDDAHRASVELLRLYPDDTWLVEFESNLRLPSVRNIINRVIRERKALE